MVNIFTATIVSDIIKIILAWRVFTGKHQDYTFSFMCVGHTRCLVDEHFGFILVMLTGFRLHFILYGLYKEITHACRPLDVTLKRDY